jgi:hypothetical protein
VLQGEAGGGGAAAATELAVDAGEVAVDGAGAEEEVI